MNPDHESAPDPRARVDTSAQFAGVGATCESVLAASPCDIRLVSPSRPCPTSAATTIWKAGMSTLTTIGWTDLLRTNDLRALVAVHEAAHAVAAIRCGWPIRYVTTASRTPGRLGCVKFDSRVREVDTWDEMTVSAAGPIAHDIITGCRDRILVSRGARTDLARIRDAARYTHIAVRGGEQPVGGLSPQATVRQIAAAGWSHAYDVVVANSGAILAVAQALVDSRRALAGRQVRALVDTAPAEEPLPAGSGLAAQFWPPGFMPPGWWSPEPRRALHPIQQIHDDTQVRDVPGGKVTLTIGGGS